MTNRGRNRPNQLVSDKTSVGQGELQHCKVNTTAYNNASAVSCPIVDGIWPVNWLLERLLHAKQGELGNTPSTLLLQKIKSCQLSNRLGDLASQVILVHAPERATVSLRTIQPTTTTYKYVRADNFPIQEWISPTNWLLETLLSRKIEAPTPMMANSKLTNK